MNRLDEYNYIMQEDLSSKERFYRFAEIVGVVPKEKPETWAALVRYRKYIKPHTTVAEIASGHGLLGIWFAWLGLCKVRLYDTRYHDNKPPAAYVLAIRLKPHLKNLIEYDNRKLKDGDSFTEDAIVGVHCCGDLTDLALRSAVKNKIPVAIMTCCHNKVITGTKRCDIQVNVCGLGLPGRVETDISRAAWLAAQNYKVSLRKIPDGITGEPRIIMGTPL